MLAMNKVAGCIKAKNNNKTKLKLLQSASDLICEGHGNIGIAEICEKAGVSKGAFYHHFYSKVDFFTNACTLEWDQLRQSLDESLAPHYNALQQLENIIQLLLVKQQPRIEGTTRACGNPFFIAGAQAGDHETEVRAIVKDMLEKELAYFAMLVRNLAVEGYVQSHIEPTGLARLVQQFIHGLLVHGQLNQNFEELQVDLREGVYRLLGLNSLTAPHEVSQ